MDGESLALPAGSLDDGVIVIRTPRPEDADGLARGVKDPAVVRFASVAWAPDTVPELEQRISTVWPAAARAGTRLDLVIADASDDSVLGYLVVFGISRRHRHCEIGFFVNPAARGRGTVPRALELVCGWAHGDGFFRVQATTNVENSAAQRALAKGGFTFEGVLRGYITRDGAHQDFQMYSRLASD